MNTRFAPSPTGDMHIGNLRAAIMPYLYARKNGCKFILRIDDTDTDRSKEYYTNGIYEDLKWLGISWDYTFKQSERQDLYDQVLKFCINHGLIYESYENEDELDELRRKLHASKKPPAYKKEHARIIEGREKYWRFDIGKVDIEFADLIKGKIKTNLSNVSDPVVCKPNGDFTYVFTSIVDDIFEKITCIIRAVDHLTNTAVQIKMMEDMVSAGLLQEIRCKKSCGSCGCKSSWSPDKLKVAHYPLFCGAGGEKFSKRTGNFSLTQLRSEVHPMALFHYMTFLGSKKKGGFYTMDQLIQEFDLTNYASSNLIEFNTEQLNKWQTRIMSNISFEEMTDWCNIGLSPNQWGVIKDAVRTKADIATWKSIFRDTRSFTVMDQVFVSNLLQSTGTIESEEYLLNRANELHLKSTNLRTLSLIDSSLRQNEKGGLRSLRKILTGYPSGPRIDEVLDCIESNVIDFRLANVKTEEDLKVRFTNSLTGQKELFFRHDQKRETVRIYACGPTVYYVPHIGNLRCFIAFDVLNRVLRELTNVVYIRNITDIDDKIINRAEELGITWQKLTKQVCTDFHKEMELLNLLPPTHEPKATENIDAIVQMIQEIIDRGIGYVNEDGVYFSIKKHQAESTYDIFGCLKNRSQEEQDDFALWKFRRETEVGWTSPWGWGRPGWHIECSAMARKILGNEKLDIHCGGKDLLFPHHTNEVAQFAACAHHEGSEHMSEFWLHNNFVNVNSEKMSKSLGNVLRLEDMGAHPMIVRTSLLLAHYRFELNWNDDLLREAASLYNKWRRNIGRFLQRKSSFMLSNGFPIYEFIYALADDLNTPAAIRVLDKLTTEIDANNVSDIIKSFGVLGIKFDFDYLENREIKYLVQKRQESRREKDFETSDKIREKLAALKVELEETKDEVLWYQEVSMSL